MSITLKVSFRDKDRFCRYSGSFTMAGNRFALSVLLAITLVGAVASADDALDVLTRAVEDGIETIDNDVDREIIRFWMDAGDVNDDQLDRCTAEYIRQLQYEISVDEQNTRLTNPIQLYDFAVHDLLSSCGIRVDLLAREMIRSLTDLQIVRLDEPAREFDLWFSRETTVEVSLMSVAEKMMWAVGATRCLNRTGFIGAWNEGPCSTVLDRIALRDMHPLVDYTEILTEIRLHPLRLGSEISPATIGAVSIVRCCRHFSTGQALAEAWDALQTSELYRTLANYVRNNDN